eukprot:6345304-Alexandrium_andersonii.AAC.1
MWGGISTARPSSAATACRMPAASSRPAEEAAPDGGDGAAPAAAARSRTPAAVTSTPSAPAWSAATMET